eukprot:5086250-Alexandrium_andersonii.AAC.1
MLPVESTLSSSLARSANAISMRAVNRGMLTTMHTCIFLSLSIKSRGGPIPHRSYDTSQGGTGING